MYDSSLYLIMVLYIQQIVKFTMVIVFIIANINYVYVVIVIFSLLFSSSLNIQTEYFCSEVDKHLYKKFKNDDIIPNTIPF